MAAVYSGVELLAQLAADGQVAVEDYSLLGAIRAILDGTSNIVERLADAVLPHRGTPIE